MQVVTVDLAREMSAELGALRGDERARAMRFRFERDRVRWMRSRAALRAVLARALDADPARLEFALEEHGKPFLAGEHLGALAFNVSHAGDRALVAWHKPPSEAGTLPQLGVDVEVVVPVPELEDVARHHFADEERRALLALPLGARTAAFHRLWTRKEAYIKAIGTGLHTPLHRFAVSHVDADVRLLHIDGDRDAAAGWSLHHLEPAPGHVGALAVREPSVEVAMSDFGASGVQHAH